MSLTNANRITSVYKTHRVYSDLISLLFFSAIVPTDLKSEGFQLNKELLASGVPTNIFLLDKEIAHGSSGLSRLATSFKSDFKAMSSIINTKQLIQ